MQGWRHVLVQVTIVKVMASLLYYCILYFLLLEVRFLKILSHLEESGNWLKKGKKEKVCLRKSAWETKHCCREPDLVSWLLFIFNIEFYGSSRVSESTIRSCLLVHFRKCPAAIAYVPLKNQHVLKGRGLCSLFPAPFQVHYICPELLPIPPWSPYRVS